MNLSIHATAVVALMGNSIDASKALLEEMTFNNYNWSSERDTPKRSIGRYEDDVVTLLASRVDALAQILDKEGTSTILGNSLGSIRLYVIL